MDFVIPGQFQFASRVVKNSPLQELIPFLKTKDAPARLMDCRGDFMGNTVTNPRCALT